MKSVIRLAAIVVAAVSIPLAAYADNWTNLRYAVYMNQEAEVVRLLDSGIDVNLANDEGWTALHVAAEQGSLRMVQYLLARGADANLKTKTGRTAFDVAQGYGEVQSALKAKMAPTADPFAAALGPKTAPPASKPAAPAAKTAAKSATQSAKPAPAAAADDHCKTMWREARALCSISDTSCNMSASIRYQSCQKKGTWY